MLDQLLAAARRELHPRVLLQVVIRRLGVDPTEEILRPGESGGADAGILVLSQLGHEPITADIERGGPLLSRSGFGAVSANRAAMSGLAMPSPLKRENGQAVPVEGLRAGSHECEQPQ
jgi:hypothetical protein